MAVNMRNAWFLVKGLLILGLRKHSSEYLHGKRHLKLEFLSVLASGARAGNLGPSAITWNIHLSRQCCYGFHFQT